MLGVNKFEAKDYIVLSFSNPPTEAVNLYCKSRFFSARIFEKNVVYFARRDSDIRCFNTLALPPKSISKIKQSSPGSIEECAGLPSNS